MKIIHITDTHIRAPGETIFGIEPAARLAAVIGHVNAQHADADLAVLTGDLTDNGAPEAYAAVRGLLAELRVPYRLLLGNHDLRAPFKAAFPEHPVDGHGFVQSVLDAPGGIGRLVLLDTLEEGRIGGVLCARRLDWLDAQLAEAEGRPLLVFLHHPPLPVGVPHFRNICMAEPQPLLDRLCRHRGGVRHMLVGHIHIPLTGVFPGGLPFTAGRGCNHQIMLDFNDAGARWAAGAPNYNVIVVDEESLFIHAVDLLDAPQVGYGQPCPGP